MLKNILKWTAVVSLLSLPVQGTAWATQTLTGRVTSYTATSISVLDRELVTLTLDGRTTYTKWVTQKPWEQDTRLTASALKVGQLVAVHRRNDDATVASWVQIATDVTTVGDSTTPAPDPVNAWAISQSEGGSSDLLTPSEVQALVASAKTSADHMKLAKHFAAVAARYDADAAEHAAEAKASRARGNPSETKRPGTPGTAVHCERLASILTDAARTARELSSQHKAMADAIR